MLGAVCGAISNAARNLKAASPEKVADLGTLNNLLGFDRIWELDGRLPQKKIKFFYWRLDIQINQ